MKRSLSLVLPSILALGCGGFRMEPVFTSKLSPHIGSIPVMRKSEQAIYVVLDPSKVRDSYVIPEDVVKEIQIYEVHEFVRRDLKAALLNFFQNVQIVEPNSEIPNGSLVAQVTLERLATRANMATSGGYTVGQVFGEMTWSFTLAQPGANDFMFVHRKTAVGSFSLVHVSQTPQMVQSTFEVALDELVNDMAQKRIADAS